MNATVEVFTILGLMFGVMAVLLLVHAIQYSTPPPKEPPKLVE